MSKQVKTEVAAAVAAAVAAYTVNEYIEKVGAYCIKKQEQSSVKADLKTRAPEFKTKASKIEADKALVALFAAHYGVKATKSDRNGRLSNLTFSKAGKEGEELKNYTNAAQALNSARNEFIDIKIVVPKTDVERAAKLLETAINDEDQIAEAIALCKRILLATKK